MKINTTCQILHPATDDEYDKVKTLIRAFVEWHRQRHVGLTLTDDYFNPAALESELASLPAKYARGRNKLLLALCNGQAAGCVALREIDPQTCEMKRMFVSETIHGKGIGRLLAQEIIQQAKDAGFAYMKLETSVWQKEAQNLYKTMGFQETLPYYPVPESVKEWLVFMELKL